MKSDIRARCAEFELKNLLLPASFEALILPRCFFCRTQDIKEFISRAEIRLRMTLKKSRDHESPKNETTFSANVLNRALTFSMESG